MASTTDEALIEKQLRFMFGRRYDNLEPVWFSDKIEPVKNFSSRNNDNLQNLIRWDGRLVEYAELLKCFLDMEDARESDPSRIVIAYTRRCNQERESIIIPLHGYYVDLTGNYPPKDEIPWQNKDSSLFWRGGTTGIDYKDRYIETQRFRFVKLLTDSKHPGVDVGFANICQSHSMHPDDLALIQTSYMRPHVPMKAIFEHKFALNLEGNDCATSFPIALNGLVCPLHPWPMRWELILHGIGPEPWKHFVPVKQDGSDVIQQYEWCLQNEKECQKIAAQGQEYMQWYRQNLPIVYTRFANRLYDLLNKSPTAQRLNSQLQQVVRHNRPCQSLSTRPSKKKKKQRVGSVTKRRKQHQSPKKRSSLQLIGFVLRNRNRR